MTLSCNLDKLLKRYNRTRATPLTCYRISKHLGIKPQSVYKWKDGITVPSTKHAVALCELLECRISDLFTEKG